MDAKKVIYAVIGLLVLFEVVKAVIPLIMDTDFSNTSIWGSFGSAILPTLFPLLLAVAILLAVFAGVAKMTGHGQGKYGL